MAWTQKNGGLPGGTPASAGRSGCRSTRSEGSRRAPVGAPPEPASPRMRLARSFRLAAERDSRGDFISPLKPLNLTQKTQSLHGPPASGQYDRSVTEGLGG